jgi:uncharacterized membrane protein
MDPYLLAKYLHILSSTVLFGTGIGTAFQMVWAMRGNEVRVISRVAQGVVLADWVFTAPAGLVQPATGLWLVWLAGYDLTEGWLVASYALYLLAFVCWAPVVFLQIRIRDLAQGAARAGQTLPQAARRAYVVWFALGWPAFAALMVIYWLMITKPALAF